MIKKISLSILYLTGVFLFFSCSESSIKDKLKEELKNIDTKKIEKQLDKVDKRDLEKAGKEIKKLLD